LGLAILGVLAAGGVYLGTRPDFDVTFVREVPTRVPLDTVDLSIFSISNWPRWFHTVAKAERMDLAGRPFPTVDQSVQPGALIRLEIEPHPGEKRGSFVLVMQVGEYVPKHLITMHLVGDRSGRIVKLFDRLEWKIELVPAPAGSPEPLLIRGTETAHTTHWRARLFGAIASRILMNQLFYPDLMALGEFTQPLHPNPYPVYGQ
jgi:hypothetical protein